MTYPPLPTIAPAQPGETLQGFGCRILAFVLTERVTATLTDEQLELADHVYPLAIANPEILITAVDRLADARREILRALAGRKADRAASQPAASLPAPVHSRPGGVTARLQPKPFTRSPGGVAIDVGF